MRHRPRDLRRALRRRPRGRGAPDARPRAAGVVERDGGRLRARRPRRRHRAPLLRALPGLRRGRARRLRDRRLPRAGHHPPARLRRELVAEAPEHLVAVPARWAASASSPSRPRSASGASATPGRSARASPGGPGARSCSGTGAIGMLATYLLRLEGHEVWTAGRAPAQSPKAPLVAALRRPVRPSPRRLAAALAEETGGFDLVMEAAGDAQVDARHRGAAAAAGVACLLGLDGRPRQVPSRVGSWASTRSSRTARSSAASTPTGRLGGRRRALDRAASAGPRRSRRSSACASRPTASATPSRTAA